MIPARELAVLSASPPASVIARFGGERCGGGPAPAGPTPLARSRMFAPTDPAREYEKLAFTFCSRLGTTGLIAWALGPPLFVLIVAVVAIVLYLKSSRTRPPSER